MIRILGIELDKNKKIWIALTKVYGIGINTSFKILRIANINPNVKAGMLPLNSIISLNKAIDKSNLQLEGRLRENISLKIRHLMDIESRRGYRHYKKLPVRGQRTKTNSRTVRDLKRGNKKTLSKLEHLNKKNKIVKKTNKIKR